MKNHWTENFQWFSHESCLICTSSKFQNASIIWIMWWGNHLWFLKLLVYFSAITAHHVSKLPPAPTQNRCPNWNKACQRLERAYQKFNMVDGLNHVYEFTSNWTKKFRETLLCCFIIFSACILSVKSAKFQPGKNILHWSLDLPRNFISEVFKFSTCEEIPDRCNPRCHTRFQFQKAQFAYFNSLHFTSTSMIPPLHNQLQFISTLCRMAF